MILPKPTNTVMYHFISTNVENSLRCHSDLEIEQTDYTNRPLNRNCLHSALFNKNTLKYTTHTGTLLYSQNIRDLPINFIKKTFWTHVLQNILFTCNVKRSYLIYYVFSSENSGLFFSQWRLVSAVFCTVACTESK